MVGACRRGSKVTTSCPRGRRPFVNQLHLNTESFVFRKPEKVAVLLCAVLLGIASSILGKLRR